jgi:hypothetical protein
MLTKKLNIDTLVDQLASVNALTVYDIQGWPWLENNVTEMNEK